jgi:hypothetical protein
MKKNFEKSLVLLIVLLVLSFIFYRYDYRVSEERKECADWVADTAQGIQGVAGSDIETFYKLCLWKRGIAE